MLGVVNGLGSGKQNTIGKCGKDATQNSSFAHAPVLTAGLEHNFLVRVMILCQGVLVKHIGERWFVLIAERKLIAFITSTETEGIIHQRTL